jgi:hypothetical protein
MSTINSRRARPGGGPGKPVAAVSITCGHTPVVPRRIKVSQDDPSLEGSS